MASYPRPPDGSGIAFRPPDGSITKVPFALVLILCADPHDYEAAADFEFANNEFALQVINNEFSNKSTGADMYPDVSGRVIPGKMPAPKDTNSNRLKMTKPEEPPDKPFVMKRFQNVPARTVSKF